MHPGRFVGGLLCGFSEVVITNHSPLLSFMPQFLETHPFPCSLLSQTIQLWCSGSGEKVVGLLGSILHSWGSQTLTMLSLSPVGDIVGWRGFSWPWTMVPWRKGSKGNVKSFFLTSLMDLFLYFFLQRGTGTSPLDLDLGVPPTKVLLSMGCQNQCFCVGEEGWKFLFHHLTDVPLYHLYHWHLKSSKKSKSKEVYSILTHFT